MQVQQTTPTQPLLPPVAAQPFGTPVPAAAPEPEPSAGEAADLAAVAVVGYN